MSKYYIYGNGGNIFDVINDLKGKPKLFSSIEAVFKHIEYTSYGLYDKFSLSIKYYGIDSRLEKTVYVITTDKAGEIDFIKKYGCPQFVQFMIEV